MAQAFHWVTLAAILLAFGSVWLAQAIDADGLTLWLIQLHRNCGALVLGLTLLRIVWRLRQNGPGLPADLPLLQRAAARSVQLALYACLIGQPLLGWLFTNAAGKTVRILGMVSLPALIGRDRALADRLMSGHETLALVFLGLIGLHAAAALFHHFVRRDKVLVSMLPQRPSPTGFATASRHRPLELEKSINLE